MMQSVRSEMIKVKHTSYWLLHIILPVVGAILFIGYFALYDKVSEVNKEKLMLELIATIFPLLISIVTGLNTLLEEKASHFQIFLSLRNRTSVFIGKLIFLVGTGLFSILLLMIIVFIGLQVLSLADISFMFFLKAGILLIIGNIIIYIWHLFLGFRFGLGISLFLGVFESLQVILYSNVTWTGFFRYIPFAWSIELCHNYLDGKIFTNIADLWILALITAIALIIVCTWVNHWEGRICEE